MLRKATNWGRKKQWKAKGINKKNSKSDSSFHAVTFDLQAVLYTPHAGQNQIYDKRQLAVYNFTIYDGSSKDGHCFVWDETEGKTGTSEISSALLK